MRGSLLVSQQVRTMLERMDMYPEEFMTNQISLGLYGNQSRWNEVINHGVFNRLEKFLIRRKIKAMNRALTQNKIMEIILEGDAPHEEKVTFSTVGRYTGNGSADRDLGGVITNPIMIITKNGQKYLSDPWSVYKDSK